MKRFPSADYGRQKLQFFAAPYKAPLRAFAVLLFAWMDDRVVICDIEGRGWCVPSGRVEPGESSICAICREAQEEAGIILAGTQYIGCYRIQDQTEVRWADCFASRVLKFQEIGIPEESRGRKLVKLEELPEIYHNWSCLTEAMFSFSFEVVQRLDKVCGPCQAEGEC